MVTNLELLEILSSMLSYSKKFTIEINLEKFAAYIENKYTIEQIQFAADLFKRVSFAIESTTYLKENDGLVGLNLFTEIVLRKYVFNIQRGFAE